MNDTPAEGKSSVPPQQGQAPSTTAQIVRQVVVIIVIVAIWTAVLVGYLALTKPSNKATDATPAPPQAAEVSFSADVLPIFEARCQRCHGSGRAEAGLSLASYADAIAGSSNGPVLVPGNADTSYLFDLVETGQMPWGSPKLPDSEIQTIRDWIDAGAPDN